MSFWIRYSTDTLRRAFSATPRASRFWEVDALRGVAIIMMIIFHLMWDLWFFRILPDVVLWEGFWKYFQRTTASLFIFLVGVSLTISYRRAVQQQGNSQGLYTKFLVRGLRIFGIGIIISLGVWLAGTGYIHFGILHLIGFSVAFAYPFLRLRRPNIGIWIAFNIVGYFLQDLRVPTTWFVWLGFVPRGYAPVDFFPVIPWFGLALLGVAAGNYFYTEKGRAFALPDLSHLLPVRLLGTLGRRSLFIYVIHQPILLAILWGLGLI
jgi:uncharacterized membrane protein